MEWSKCLSLADSVYICLNRYCYYPVLQVTWTLLIRCLGNAAVKELRIAIELENTALFNKLFDQQAPTLQRD